MCVIMVASKIRPTDEMIQAAWESNKDGGGVAWREEINGQRVVRWKKGIMTLDAMREQLARTPLPYVAHFRVASVGGVRPSLTHPFLVNSEASLELEGETTGAVLFHNGHWSQWNDRALEAAIHSNNAIPEGSEWSDTRAMAWMVHIYGAGLMELLTTQRGVLLGPNKMNIFTGNGWETINGIYCSNDNFWRSRKYNYSSMNHNHDRAPYQSHRPITLGPSTRYCSRGKCTNKAQTGKDICEACETKEADGNKAVETKPNIVSIARGGTSGPLAEIFSMKEVEAFHQRRLISKSMLKKYRKANGAQSEKGNRGLRAQKQMKDLSLEIAERLSDGSGT